MGQWPYNPGMKLTLSKTPAAALQAFMADVPVKDDVLATPAGQALLLLEPFDGRVIVKRVVAMDRGAGRAAMEIVCAAADKHRITLRLFAHPLASAITYAMPRRQLERWYESFGFEQRGHRAGNGDAQMERKPR